MNKEEMIEKCGEKFYNDFMNARREAMKIYSERKEEFCKRNEERKRKNMENVANIHKKVFGEEKEINTNIINTNIREYKIQDGIFVDICVTFIDNEMCLRRIRRFDTIHICMKETDTKK